MRILVTGSSGFIGKHVMEDLGEEHDLIPFGRPSDLLNKEDLDRMVRNIDLIIHAAGKVEAKNSMDYLYNNVIGTIQLVDYANRDNVEGIIYLSALNGIYDTLGIAKEDTPIYPASKYIGSKYIGEQVLHFFNGNTIILRLGGVFGIGRRHKCCIEKLLTDHEVIINNSKEIWDMIYVKDVVRAINLAVEHIDRFKYNAFNIGSGNTKTIGEIANFVKSFRNVKVIYKEDPHSYRQRICDISKARKLLGFIPKKLENTILEYYKELNNEHTRNLL